MKSIIEELYFGNIKGCEIRVPKADRDKELAVYDELKATLTPEQSAMLENFIKLMSDNSDFILMKAFRRAFAVGVLLGIEITEKI